MTEMNFVDSKDLREQNINRLEVLDKVKQLFLIPDMNVMTSKQVADYYEVPLKTLISCYTYNKDEIYSDGVTLKTYGDFKKIENQSFKHEHGKAIVKLSENITLEIPTRGILCFSKRAILRIGMLLRDSNVAKEVRTQLLNTFENASIEQRTSTIVEEENLWKDLYKAVTSEDFTAETKAKSRIIAFQYRHIKKLEDEKKILTAEILKWDDRSKLNKAVRSIASARDVPFGCVWNELYNELLYKHHIGLKNRGNAPYIQHIKENEWALVQQSLAAICEKNAVSLNV